MKIYFSPFKRHICIFYEILNNNRKKENNEYTWKDTYIPKFNADIRTVFVLQREWARKFLYAIKPEPATIAKLSNSQRIYEQ